MVYFAEVNLVIVNTINSSYSNQKHSGDQDNGEKNIYRDIFF